jgi:RHS repeat-associated protein
LNAFRYRGYYYDIETGLYYLESRYYDPETGRFLNSDSVEYLDPETLGGLNLYAYCNNNPVMGYDPSGTFWFALGLMALGGLMGAVFSAGASVLSQIAEDGEVNKAAVGVAALAGFIGGAVGASPLGVGWQMALGGLIEGAAYVADCMVQGEQVYLDDAIVSIVIGIGSGAFGNGANYQMNLSYTRKLAKNNICREMRRQNQEYAQKVIAANKTTLRNLYGGFLGSRAVGYARGNMISNTVSKIYNSRDWFPNQRSLNEIFS